MNPDERRILEALSSVREPELDRDIVALEMVRDLAVSDSQVSMKVVLVTPGAPHRGAMEAAIRAELSKLGFAQAQIRWDTEIPQARSGSDKPPMPGIKNIVAVGSGKGGVGKTTVSVNVAVGLRSMGAAVGLLDADVYGPNVPLMIGASGQPRAIGEDRIEPLQQYGMPVMSMGFLNPGDKPVIWRGPMLHSVMQQFLKKVDWGELDYLVIDLPPGTGDVQLSLIQTVPVTGAVVVTTPSDVSLEDARKAVQMFHQVRVEVLGIAENMSFLVCPHCKEPYQPSDTMLDTLARRSTIPSPAVFFHGRGCKKCLGTGYAGRVGIFEIMVVSPALAEAIERGLPSAKLRELAGREGITELVVSGMDLAMAGQTTIEEVYFKLVA